MARVVFDVGANSARLEGAVAQATHITAQQALKDCNYFCKQDQSTLVDSSITHSRLEDGKLIWHTPYARKQYYLRATRLEVNANARFMWAHYAATKHKDDWLAVFRAAFARFLERGGGA